MHEQYNNNLDVIDIKKISKNDLSFEVLGVSEVVGNEDAREDESKKIFKMFPQGK